MKYIKRLLMLLIVIVLVIGGYYVYLGYQMYDKAKEEKPFDEMVETIKSNQSYT